MGEALGKALWAGLLVFGFMALTGGIALISGIVALFVRGAAGKTPVFGLLKRGGKIIGESYNTLIANSAGLIKVFDDINI